MSKLEKISILMAAYNSPSKLEGVSRSDEGVCGFCRYSVVLEEW